MSRSFWSLFTVTVVSSMLSACATYNTASTAAPEVKESVASKRSQTTAPDSTKTEAITDPAIEVPTIPEPSHKIIIRTSGGQEIEISVPASSTATGTSDEEGGASQQETRIIEVDEGHARLLKKRTVFFDFDSSDIFDDDRQIIEAHARLLAENGDISMVLQGHADERGSREYNIALGERRASGVSQLMELLGVSDRQLRVVSYGEERPVAREHNEAAWRINRRANLTYHR